MERVSPDEDFAVQNYCFWREKNLGPRTRLCHLFLEIIKNKKCHPLLQCCMRKQYAPVMRILFFLDRIHVYPRILPRPPQKASLNFVSFFKQKADFICQQTIVNKYEHLFCLLCLWILIKLFWLEASLIVTDFTFAVYGSSCNFVVSFSLLFFLYLFHGIPSCRGEAIKKNYF